MLSAPHLGGLSLGRRGADFAADADAAADAEMEDLVLVVGQLAVGDDLNVAEAGAVIDFEEAEAPLVAAGADPSLELDVLADCLRLPRRAPH